MQVEERGCDKGIERRKRWIEQSGLRRGKFGKMGPGRGKGHSRVERCSCLSLETVRISAPYRPLEDLENTLGGWL